MKYYFLLLLAATFCLACDSGQTGRYAGSMKSLPGTIYSDSIELSALDDWSFMSGSMISAPGDPEVMLSDVYSKGNTQIVFFSILEDSIKDQYRILDVVEVNDSGKALILTTAFCSQDKKEDPMIVAQVKWSPDHEVLNAEKAWRFNREKNVFESIPVKGVTCLNAVD